MSSSSGTSSAPGGSSSASVVLEVLERQKMTLSPVEKQEEFEDWEWAVMGKFEKDEMDISKGIQKLLNADANTDGKYPQTEDIEPGSDERKKKLWRSLTREHRDKFKGEAAKVPAGKNLSFLDCWRKLRGKWGSAKSIGKSKIYSEVVSGKYEEKTDGDVEEWLNERLKKVQKVPK